MKGVFLQKNLTEGLKKVSHLASIGKESLPILNNILIRAEKGLLYIVSTNLEIAIETYIRGKIEKTGSFTIPANLFSSHLNFLPILPNDSIKLEVIENELCLKYKNGETKIKGLPAEDFPIIPRLEKKDGIKILGKELKKSLQQVIIATPTSESRPEISGVLFNQKEKNLVLVGTDSYRLAEKVIEIKNSAEEGEGSKKTIIPIKTCQELLRILEDDEVEIFFSESQSLFSQGSTSLISRIIQAEFPNYQEIIPKNFRTKVSVNKENLAKTIKGASLFSKFGVNDISFDFLPEKQKIIISSLNPQLGGVKLEVEAEVFGEKNSLSFNYRYFLEGLMSVPTDEINLEIIDDSSPVIIKPTSEEKFIYLLMPIKT